MPTDSVKLIDRLIGYIQRDVLFCLRAEAAFSTVMAYVPTGSAFARYDPSAQWLVCA